MKKSLTALAVVAAISAPLAAQAGDMEAKVYGKMHMSVDYVDNKVDGMSGADIVHMSTNSSRLGFKGSADVSGGMKAVWQIETGVAVGEGTSPLGDRNTFAGLSTGAGAVTLGRQDTPVKGIGRKLDFFGDQIGDSRNVIMTTAKGDARPTETVMYVSPSFSGAQVALETNLSTGAADSALGLISAALTYNMGKDLYVGAGYNMASKEYLGGAATESESLIRAGAKYNMGAISVGLLFQMSTNESGVKDSNRMSYGGGASYKMGMTTLKAQAYMNGDVDGDKSNGTVFAVGADQKLGDKTAAYVAFAMSMSGDAATYGVATSGHASVGTPTTAGDGAMGLSVGLTHSF